MKKEERNKKKRRKIFLSLLLILFVGVILTASTYTWFTANRQVTVENLDVNVSTSAGLQISVDAMDWKTVVTKEDIIGAITTYKTAKNQVPAGQVNPVSTAGTVDAGTGFINMYKGSLADEDTDGAVELTATKSTETNTTDSGDFIAFDLFFNVSEDQTLYLTSASQVTGGNADGAGTDSKIQYASRVAMLPQGHVTDVAQSATIQAAKATDTTGLVIWEPNADIHTATGVTNAALYGKTVTAAAGNAPVEYYGLISTIDTPGVDIDSTDGGKFKKVEAPVLKTTDSTGIPEDNYLQVLSLERGVTKVRFYMWVEGQDVDCEDYASGGDLNFNLVFSIDPQANA